MINRYLILLLLTVLFTSCSKEHVITIINNSEIERVAEITEIDLSEVTQFTDNEEFRLVDSDGKEIPYQITYDDKVIFPITMSPGEQIKIRIHEGIPVKTDTVACGAFYPQRKDDLAWENDKSAYRAYGPELQNSGERAYGYDIWTKSVVNPVVARRYFEALEQGKPYHQDRGDGMDVYTVGPTLGGGTAAIIDTEGNIVYPWAFKDYEILDNGPLRFTVALSYETGETRLISLDAGEYLNRTSIRFPHPQNNVIAPGIVLHRQNPDGFELEPEKGFMAYADLTDNANAGNGVIYVGIVVTDVDSMVNDMFQEPKGDAIGHILAKKTYTPGEDYTYYWGSGWSKGSMPDWESWKNYLENFRKRLDSPLKVTVR